MRGKRTRLVVGSLFLLLGFIWNAAARCENAPAAAETAVQTLAPLVKRIIRSVVNVKAASHPALPMVDPGSGFPDGPLELTQNVRGAGVVADADLGLIVTCHHVVMGADAISVETFDGRQSEAALVSVDKEADLAVLRIPTQGLIDIPIGQSEAIEPGEFVLAVGNPLGLGQSVSFGIVSALHRSWPGVPYPDLIQVDVLLDRGSSGGPVFSMRGEVIGLATARAGESVNERSFGFAVPAAAVSKLLAKSRGMEF